MKPWTRFEKSLFAAFLLWSGAGLIFTVGHITPDVISHGPIPDWLVQFINFCLRTGDPILILLAFANTHLHAARQWTAGVARRWGVLILLASFGIETLGVRT